MPWIAGMLLAGLVGGTVLVTDSAPSDLQGTQWMWLSAVMTVVLPLWLAGYIVDPQRTVRIVSESVQLVLMGFGAMEALHGLGQIAGIYPSNHSLFVLTGTFYNPGPYSGYLAAVLPIALFRMLVSNGKKDRLSVVQYYFSMCVLLLICCVLPAGMSRAAWFASLISCGYVVLRAYRVKVKSFVSKHRYAVSGVLIVGALLASSAYFMKRDSADGRLLIWKITSQAIASSPWGEENGRTFSAIYGDAQERYFTNCEYSESEAWVAGTPDFAFNEFLQIAVVHGIWMPVRVLNHSGAFNAAAEEYGKLYDKMSWNKDFCFEYGRALYKVGSYDKAEEVLLKAMAVSGDPMILNMLGRNAQENGEYKKAEKYLLRSTHRLPERIYPHYLLVKLYAEPEFFDRIKFVSEAEHVLNAKPKVNSTAIREMKQEVNKILRDKETLENK